MYLLLQMQMYLLLQIPGDRVVVVDIPQDRVVVQIARELLLRLSSVSSGDTRRS
jgi:hypothetical protein